MGILDGKVAIVTGAAGGIGAAYAGRLATLGAVTYLADINRDQADETAEKLRAEGGEGIGAQVDISESDSCAALAERVIGERGRLDILVNNAAMFRGLPMETVEDVPIEVWRRYIDVNVTGTFLMCRAVIPQMRRQRSGRIVNQSSIAGWLHPPLMSHYVVSKAAVVSLTQCLASELGEDNITVNAIAPGMITTAAMMESSNQTLRDMFEMNTKLGRLGTPEDLLGTLEFLCGPGSNYMTGQVLIVDGGTCMLS